MHIIKKKIVVGEESSQDRDGQKRARATHGHSIHAKAWICQCDSNHPDIPTPSMDSACTEVFRRSLEGWDELIAVAALALLALVLCNKLAMVVLTWDNGRDGDKGILQTKLERPYTALTNENLLAHVTALALRGDSESHVWQDQWHTVREHKQHRLARLVSKRPISTMTTVPAAPGFVESPLTENAMRRASQYWRTSSPKSKIHALASDLGWDTLEETDDHAAPRVQRPERPPHAALKRRHKIKSERPLSAVVVTPADIMARWNLGNNLSDRPLPDRIWQKVQEVPSPDQHLLACISSTRPPDGQCPSGFYTNYRFPRPGHQEL